MWSATLAVACRALVCITVTAAVSLPGQEDSYKGMVKPQLLQGPWSCGPLLVLLGVLRFWGAARALSSWELGGDGSVSAQKSSHRAVDRCLQASESRLLPGHSECSECSCSRLPSFCALFSLVWDRAREALGVALHSSGQMLTTDPT